MLLRPFTVSMQRVMSYTMHIHSYTKAYGQPSVVGSPAFPSHLSPARPIPGSSRSLRLNINDPSNRRADSHHKVIHYSRRYTPACPDPTSAAIALTFALKEATPLEMPPHLPESRAIAIANQRFGPTMGDYRTIACCRTPLFADTRPEIFSSREPVAANVDLSRSVKHDQDYYRILRSPDDHHGSEVHSYIPGMLTGLWEGTFMVSS